MSFITPRASISINLIFKQFHAPAYRITSNSFRNFTASAMVNAKYKEGQQVEYKPVGGRDSNTSSSTGTIERVITEDAPAGSTGVTVKADPEHPRYEVKNDKTGKTSAVKEENILKAL
ncbi:hypothetical protein EV426DRAFT_675410 [Tirmania nivea]|nr:hypothetical protein EV426DRAFT_675410 [Tirmania nivea]